MRKSEKFTQIYFNEADPTMEITTHNADLKKRLRRFAEEFPVLCRVTEIDSGKMSFEIDKHRCSLRLTMTLYWPRQKHWMCRLTQLSSMCSTSI